MNSHLQAFVGLIQPSEVGPDSSGLSRQDCSPMITKDCSANEFAPKSALVNSYAFSALGALSLGAALK